MGKLLEETYVDRAEKVIKSMITKDRFDNNVLPITTSKIRNLLQMITDIYNDVVNSSDKKLSTDQMSRVQYLKVRFLYEAGRDQKGVKVLVEKAEILECLNQIKDSRKEYILFTRYMEALVAYHKFYGGKD